MADDVLAHVAAELGEDELAVARGHVGVKLVLVEEVRVVDALVDELHS